MKIKAGLFQWLLPGLLVVPCFSFASYPTPPPQRDRVIGVWVGYSNHDEFVRVELDRDGTGYVSLGSGVDDTFNTYRVRSWTLREWNITLEAVPLTGDAEPVKFDKVGCYLPIIELEFSGTAGNWNRKVELYSERALKDDAKRAASAVSKSRNNKGR